MRIVRWLVILALAIPAVLARSSKSIGVTGNVKCDGQPVSNAQVQLYSERDCIFFHLSVLECIKNITKWSFLQIRPSVCPGD
ncbi:unnamed protein product [Gongylonema pulchrum]|uniref:Transthyretin-like family protein n=1 Tax=Gongylonema pulchrum TaxID=637853 RepID=A0A183D797_9BILA|nr:unnamed protein product [Gongylonema pulchrum]